MNHDVPFPPYLLSSLKECRPFLCAIEAFNYADQLYKESREKIEHGFEMLVRNPKECEGVSSDATYPFVGISVEAQDIYKNLDLSFGILQNAGVYGATLTRPDLFRSYYIEQFDCLLRNHRTPLWVGLSGVSIPFPYVMEHPVEQLDDDQLWTVRQGFVLPNLSRLNDALPNGTSSHLEGNPYHVVPLSLFSAERVDYSLHRLHHYTGTPCEHFQGFVLLTNYQRYIDSFIEYSAEKILTDDAYTELVGPGNFSLDQKSITLMKEQGSIRLQAPPHLPQMPAYHLKRRDKMGITFINIGVGPSNAKNITDHLAVLRPQCWLMIGHCAGLRSTQALGDYVLAHAYVREDSVLDQDLPPWIPLPAIAEVQVALQEAIYRVIGTDQSLSNAPNVFKKHVRTGTIVTTGDRNWELRSEELYQRFRQSRAIAVDMESATIAGNGFRFRVPYGTLLCVSDKPIHGEIKLQSMANSFYKKRVSQHLSIGLETIEILRKSSYSHLHSRKLRSFDDPAFR